MKIEIKLARTEVELDELFQARHRVFVEEEGYLAPSPEARIADRFDAFPTTGNVIVRAGQRVVGGLRIIAGSRVGTSADAYFDFRPYLPAGARPGAASLLCLERQYRESPRALVAMLSMAFKWAQQHNLTHLVGACNPDVKRMFLAIGFRPVAPQFYDERHQLQVLPMILDLGDLHGRLKAFMAAQRPLGSPDAFDWLLFQAGDGIGLPGETPGRYLVLNGAIQVRAAGTDAKGSVVTERTLFDGDVLDLEGDEAGAMSIHLTAQTDVSLMPLPAEGELVLADRIAWRGLSRAGRLQAA